MDEFLPKVISTLPTPPPSMQSVILSLPSLLSSSSTTLFSSVETSSTLPSCPYLKPKAFFPAFHGTLTLAFNGWPRSICAAKSCVDAAHAQLAQNPHTQETHANAAQDLKSSLRAENAGTKWPKVTLGVLGDGVKLNEEDGKRLLQVLERINKELLNDSGDVELGEKLDVMDIVLYNKRSLQAPRLASYRVHFHKGHDNTTKDDIDSDSRGYVDKVLSEPEDFATYFPHINDTSRRLAFYTEPCEPAELTLVHFITSPNLRAVLQKFCKEIDSEFPNLYHWMPEEAWHVSIRALNFL